VTRILGSAFNSSGLVSLAIPDSVTFVDTAAFANCTQLRSIKLPAGETTIRTRLFENCSLLSSVTIPNTVTKLEDEAFYKCTSLESITLPDSVRGMGMFTFAYSGLKSIDIPSPVYCLDIGLFLRCPNLTEVNIPNDGHLELKGRVFEGCTSLKRIVFPDCVFSLEGSLFKDCTSLESVKFSANQHYIGDFHFSNCTSLRSITIPYTIAFIGDHAFDGCTNLTEANFLGNAPHEYDFGVSVFDNCAPDFKITYLNGKTGFSNPFHGYPVKCIYELSQDIETTVVLPGNINPDALENLPEDNGNSEGITLKAAAGVGYVKLDWNRITDPKVVSGYNIYKSTSSGNHGNTPVNEAAVTGNTFSDTNVQAGTAYFYVVKPVFRDNTVGAASNEVSATPKGNTGGTIELTINNPLMNLDGVKKDIDAGFNTAPIIKDGRTFLPIRALLEEMGGTIAWDAADKRAAIEYNGKTIELWIGKTTVRVNGKQASADAAPFTSKTGRVMLPLRFVGEALDCDVSWDPESKSITISGYGIGDTPEESGQENSGAKSNDFNSTSLWAGTWDATWGTLELVQSGDKVKGSFTTHIDCKLTGTVSGNTLAGSFVENEGTEGEITGTFKCVMSDSGKDWEGTWTESGASEEDMYNWPGTKIN
jgi:hypothetical protein